MKEKGQRFESSEAKYSFVIHDLISSDSCCCILQVIKNTRTVSPMRIHFSQTYQKWIYSRLHIQCTLRWPVCSLKILRFELLDAAVVGYLGWTFFLGSDFRVCYFVSSLHWSTKHSSNICQTVSMKPFYFLYSFSIMYDAHIEINQYNLPLLWRMILLCSALIKQNDCYWFFVAMHNNLNVELFLKICK